MRPRRTKTDQTAIAVKLSQPELEAIDRAIANHMMDTKRFINRSEFIRRKLREVVAGWPKVA